MGKNDFDLDLEGLFKEMNEELEEIKETVDEEFIGEKIYIHCPECDKETEFEILKVDEAKCSKCCNIFPLELNIEE